MFTMLLLALTAPAQAQQACETHIDAASLLESLGKAEEAFTQVDVQGFLGAMGALETGVRCAEEAVPASVVARMHRMWAFKAFADRDGDKSRKAFAAARRLDPAYQLPPAIPAKHPLREAFDGMPAELSGTTSLAPAGQGNKIYFDGRPGLERPVDQPVYAQIIDSKGLAVVSGYLWPGDPMLPYVEATPEELAGPGPSRDVNWLVDLHVGARLPLGALGIGPLPTLEGSFVLPALGKRLSVGVVIGYAYHHADGEGADPTLPDPGLYTWTMALHEVQFGLNLTARLFGDGRGVDPEISVGPQGHLWIARTDGETGGVAFGTQEEVAFVPGFRAALGVGLALGPGRLVPRVGFSGNVLDGWTTGWSRTIGPFVTVGYRLEL